MWDYSGLAKVVIFILVVTAVAAVSLGVLIGVAL